MTLIETVVFIIFMMINYWIGWCVSKFLHRCKEKPFVDKFIKLTHVDGTRFSINCSKIVTISEVNDGVVLRIVDVDSFRTIKVRNSYEDVLSSIHRERED